MGEKTKKTTRREFLELAAAGATGVAAASVGSDYAIANAKGRAHYKLYSPGRIGSMPLKNRFVRSAVFENGGAPNGEVLDAYVDIHRAYAEGGVCLSITGYIAVMEYGKKGTHVCAYDDKFIPGLARVADVVHSVGNGCKIAAEIGHDGTSASGRADVLERRQSPTGVQWPSRIGPSGINWAGREEGHALSIAEIDRFTTDMGEATRRLKEAGFDGVEIHGAHHYLVNTFLSPFTNQRTDKYGGSLENRVRIVREMVEKMRDHGGDDFPILIMLNCDDGPQDNGTEGEINIDTFPELVNEIVKTGVDAIDISGSEKPGDPRRMRISKPERQSFYERYADSLNIDVPVILGCGHRNVELLEEIIKKEKVDFFNFARPLLREPDLPNRWLEGRGRPEADCISVNLCFRALNEMAEPVHCVVLRRKIEKQKAEAQAARQYRVTVFGV